MSPWHLCPVCDKPSSTIWPGLCVVDAMHTPAAALDAHKITPAEFDFGLRDMSRRLAELEQQVRGILARSAASGLGPVDRGDDDDWEGPVND